MNVFVTRPAFLESQVWEEGYAKGFTAELRAHPTTPYKVVDLPDESEIVILLESNTHKTAKIIPDLLKEPMLTGFCAKVCSINYEDTPAGFLRGLYTSLESGKFDSSIHKSWPAIYLPNENVYEADDQLIWNTEPSYLFSFVGSMSHPLRSRLVKRYSAPSMKYKVIESTRWYNHNSEDFKSYIDNILSSQFALCPRGHSSYTHRISEVMALGRVPVVIADGWIPFSIPEDDYFIRIPEAEVNELEAILEAKKHQARAMGRRAREIWLKYFSKSARASAAVDAARDLVARSTKSLSLAAYHRRWQSYHFKRSNRMTLWQRAWRKCKDMARSG